MEWNDWETFCRVVEAGSFTAAAEALGIPKSTASAAVSRLEASLGVRLLTRTTRQLRLTEAGSHFYDDIAPLFERLREVHADTTAASETVSGALRIAAPYEVGAQYLTEPVCQALARFPHLQIQVHISWEQPDLLASGYDIVFVMVDQTLADSSLVARRVVMIPRALYAAPSLLAGRAPLATPADLSGWPCLSGPDDASWGFRPAGAPAAEPFEVPIQPRLQTLNAEMRVRAAVRGLGVARMARSVGDAEVETGRLVRVLSDYEPTPLRVYALMPARKLVPRKVRVFLDALEAQGMTATLVPGASA